MNNILLGILIGVICSFMFVVATLSMFFNMWLDLNTRDLAMLDEIIKVMKFLIKYDKLAELDAATNSAYSARNPDKANYED